MVEYTVVVRMKGVRFSPIAFFIPSILPMCIQVGLLRVKLEIDHRLVRVKPLRGLLPYRLFRGTSIRRLNVLLGIKEQDPWWASPLSPFNTIK